VLHYTPNFQLAYIDADTPLEDLAAASRTLAEKADAALTAGGVAAPGAAELTTLGGRVNVLEPKVTALEGERPGAWTALPLNAPHVWLGGAFPPNRIRRENLKTGRLQLALTSASTTGVICTLPVGLRPAYETALRVQLSPSATTWASVKSNGQVNLIGVTGIAYALLNDTFPLD
jgi:hypothetical protein